MKDETLMRFGKDEEESIIRQRAINSKDKEKYYKEARAAAKKGAMPVVIDGVYYDSPGEAARATGSSKETIRRHAKKLAASQRSEMDFEVNIKKTMTFSKPEPRHEN